MIAQSEAIFPPLTSRSGFLFFICVNPVHLRLNCFETEFAWLQISLVSGPAKPFIDSNPKILFSQRLVMARLPA
ncbi:MAG: hypothetical protein MUF86_07585 [Akkermansiaceae bacterium]|nr:hypothetical protein [Akkermansiaceae bacterium]